MFRDEILIHLSGRKGVVWHNVDVVEDTENAVYAVTTIFTEALAGEVQKSTNQSQSWVFVTWLTLLHQLAVFKE